MIEPGIYGRDQIDEPTYRALDAVNFSTLKAVAKSPLHYRHALDAPDEPTDAKRLGSLAHTAILEPERLSAEYAVWPPAEWPTQRRQGKMWDAFVDLAADKGLTIVRREEVELAHGMAAAVRSNHLAKRYLAAGDAEQVLIWRDEPTGILCKGRLDWISRSVPHAMIEVKTSRDVSPFFFEKNFALRAFDVQCAFYCDGYAAITGHTLYPKCVAVENVRPHDVIVYDLLETLEIGRALYREMLDRVAECRKSNKWPGQAPDAERILRLPPWRDPSEQDDDLADLEMETSGHV